MSLNKKTKVLPYVYRLILFIALLPGCATWGEFDQLKKETDLIRKDVLEQKRENAELKRELDLLKKETVELSKRLSDKREDVKSIRETHAEIYSRLLDISKELQLLTGRFDESRYFVEKTLKHLASERDHIKAQLISLEGQIKDIRERLAIKETPTRHTIEPPTEKTPKDKAKMYEEAYIAFKDKKYKEARERFEAFLKEFPNDELTDNAQFWIAETYYCEKDFESAIVAYDTLLKRYPKSEKAPGALLKQGFSFIELGDKKTGKVILEQLIERYPRSKEADIAKKKIEEIKRK